MFPIPTASVVGIGFTLEADLTGVHTLTADPPTIAVFMRGRDGKTYMARFTQTKGLAVELSFSAEPEAGLLLDEAAPR